MKKIIFLLLCTVTMYGQTLQNPTFGNTTTNTLKVKNSATVTSVNFLPAFDADGISVSKIDPVNLPISTATINAINTQDATALHKTGNETKNNNLTFTDNIISSGNNALSSNTQTAGIRITDVGALMSNYTLYTDSFGAGAPNVRIELGSNLAHIGFNKLGTVNSALAFLFDTTLTSGNIDFRGPNYVNGTDLFQFTDFKQINSDFRINNNKSGGKILFPSGKIGIGTSNIIGDFTVKVPTTLTFDMASQDDGSIAFANFAGGSYVPAIVGKSGSGTGLRLFSGTSNSNASPDMMFDVRSTANANFTTLTSVAFRFARFSSTALFDIFRNGNATLLGQLTSTALILNTTPSTATGTPDLLVYESASVPLKKIPFNTFAKADSPAFTGTPTAPTAAAGTNSTQLATTAFVQNSTRPYKSYSALISQSGTDAPTVTILENTLSGTIVWTRTGTGSYNGTLTGEFLSNKTFTLSGEVPSTAVKVSLSRASDNIVSIYTSSSGTLQDGLVSNTPIEIRVYN